MRRGCIKWWFNMPLMKALPAEPRPDHHGDLRCALIDATMALVTEEQDWSFSLREVARRAGVSHNAPYNHFAEKRDLLGAVAAMGFEMLRDRMLAVITKIRSADAALSAAANAYVGFAIENPALYRLMFGPVLAAGRSHSTWPVDALIAGAEAKAVLEDITSVTLWTGHIRYKSLAAVEALNFTRETVLSQCFWIYHSSRVWESQRDFQRVWEGWKAGFLAFHAFHTLSFPWPALETVPVHSSLRRLGFLASA